MCDPICEAHSQMEPADLSLTKPRGEKSIYTPTSEEPPRAIIRTCEPVYEGLPTNQRSLCDLTLSKNIQRGTGSNTKSVDTGIRQLIETLHRYPALLFQVSSSFI